MKNKVLLILLSFFIVLSCAQLNNPFLETSLNEHNDHNTYSQILETRGKEFYLAFSENYNLSDLELTLMITGYTNTTGNIQINGLNINIPFSVSANETCKISIPKNAIITSNDTIENLGIYINSDNPISVTGLSHGPATTDSFLVYPAQSLSMEYYALSYKSKDSGIYGSNFIIVASQEETSINITPAITSGSRTAGITYNINLNANQTYRLTDTPDNLGDVTGSHIVSNKPIAVFSGNRIANIPIDVFYGDHILDQMIPVDYWSNSYIAIPLADRDRYTLRILAAKNDTLININDSVNTTINAGEFYELIMTETAVISSNEQVLIAQFAHGGQDDAILTEMGDPFMVILPSENQFINNYKFSTIESTITNNYINLIINKNDINNIKLDDSAIDPLLFFNINETYSGAKVPISEGNHTIKSIMKFGLIIYGFDRYDSYGHTGG